MAAMEVGDFDCVACSKSLIAGNRVFVIEQCEHLVHQDCGRNATGTCPVDGQVYDIEALCTTTAITFSDNMATRFSRLMANSSNTHCRRNIAWLYSNERANEKEAVKWLMKAVNGAEQNPIAMLDLAARYSTGKGVTLNQDMADQYKREAEPLVESLSKKNENFLGIQYPAAVETGKTADADSTPAEIEKGATVKSEMIDVQYQSTSEQPGGSGLALRDTIPQELQMSNKMHQAIFAATTAPSGSRNEQSSSSGSAGRSGASENQPLRTYEPENKKMEIKTNAQAALQEHDSEAISDKDARLTKMSSTMQNVIHSVVSSRPDTRRERKRFAARFKELVGGCIKPPNTRESHNFE